MQQTSMLAFFEIKGLGAKQRRIYDLLQEHGPLSNSDISECVQAPVNEVTPRVYELRAMGKVEEAYKASSRQTGKKVIFWRTV